MTFHDGRWSFAIKLRTGFGAREWMEEALVRSRRAALPAAREALS